MTLVDSLRKFFGEEVHEPQTTARASAFSVEIVSYALSLASTPDALTPQKNRLAKLASSRPDEIALAKLYLEIERYLVTKDPARKFESEHLRQQIWERYHLIESPGGLSVLFAPAGIQTLKLAKLIMDDIVSNSARVLNQSDLDSIKRDSVKSPALQGVTLTATSLNLVPAYQPLILLPPAEFEPVFEDLRRLFTQLYERLRDVEGARAQDVFEKAYLGVGSSYETFIEGLSKVSTLFPDGVLEGEKLRYLSRETLEDRVREKTKQLEAEKQGIEQKVKARTQELNETQATLSSTVESLSQGLLMVDNDNHIAVRNAAVTKVLGYGKRQWSLNNLAHDTAASVSLFDSIQAVREKSKPLTLPEVKFDSKILRFSLSPVLTSGRVIGVVLLIEDITEAKILERSREEFFSIASHELRTPLTAIRGNTALIEQYYQEVLKDESLRGMIEDIHESSVRLIDIVNDFLDASRLEQGRMKFTFTDFNVADVIEKTIYELAAVSREKHIYLRADPNIKSKQVPLVHADVDRVKQVIYNMVGNAMKFVETGGVTISAEPIGTQVKISVADTGLGISPENQKLLFHKFQQAGSSIVTRDTTRGTGLGLYISKLLLEQMNGSITLERSVVGKGSTFTFTLPLGPKAPADVKAP